MSTKRSLSGCLALITGGSSGIGLATAKLLVRRGASVVIVARQENKLRTALAELDSVCQQQKVTEYEAKPRLIARAVDVSNREQVEELASSLQDEYGPLDVLINCAGVTHPGYFENLPYEVFDELMRIDFFGTLNMCRSFVPSMKGRGGHVVNVSSAAGLYGIFGYTAYSAAKFAVVGFSQALRSELKPYNVWVSVVCPPDTDTPQLAYEEQLKPPETRAIARTASVLSADEVARHIGNCLFRDRFLVIPGFQAKLAYVAARLAPRLLEYYLDRQVRLARQQGYTGKT